MQDYKHVLIAVDFSQACKNVLNKGLTLAKQNNSSLTLLHIVEFLPPLDFANEPMATPDWVLNEEELIKNAENSLHNLREEYQVPEAELLVLAGSPKHEIVRIADEKNADLIVIGSHGRHGFSRLLGSTAYPVLHHANCDVLSVRIKE